MAIHEDELSMLQSSLPEFLWLAAIGLETSKGDGGVLGYPSALLLLSVIDAIGSYYRGRREFTVDVEGVERAINTDADHFLVLNSRLFGYELSSSQLGKIYRLARSALTHHAIIGEDVILSMAPAKGHSFRFIGDAVVLELPQLLMDCEHAIEKFLAEAAQIVLGSSAVAELRMKSARAAANRARRRMESGDVPS